MIEAAIIDALVQGQGERISTTGRRIVGSTTYFSCQEKEESGFILRSRYRFASFN